MGFLESDGLPELDVIEKGIYEVDEEVKEEDVEDTVYEEQIAQKRQEEEVAISREAQLTQFFNRTFQYFITQIRKRLRDDWDQVVAITGYEGTGKSTCAIILGQHIDKSFSLTNNVAYLPNEDELRNKFNDIKRFGCFIVDEAVKSLHKHNWMNKLQQNIVRMYATERFQNKCTILCIPRFTDLTENFRNHRVNLWIHVVARGHAIVYVKDRDKDSQDPWHIYQNRKQKEIMFKNKRIADQTTWDIVNAERRTKGYLFDFRFPDLSPEDKEEYTNLKIQSRIDEATKEDEEENEDVQTMREKKYRNSIVNVVKYLKNEHKLTFKAISEITKMSPTAIGEYYKEKIE